MECNGCDGCGKTYPDLKQIFFCKCFLAGFCSTECFEGSSHLTECDQIAGPISRLRGSSDYGVLLSEYTMNLGKFAAGEITSEDAMKRLTAIADQVKNDQRRAELKVVFSLWHKKNTSAITSMLAGNKAAALKDMESVKTASQTVIALFKSENKISLRQRGKDIENAWNSYIAKLSEAIQSVPMKGTEVDMGPFQDAAILAISVGRVLGGGKDVNK